MKIAIRDTYRPAGWLGGDNLYITFLAPALSKVVDRLDIYTPDPALYAGCNTVAVSRLHSPSRLRRNFTRIKTILAPAIENLDYSCVIFPNQWEPLVDAPRAKRVVVIHDLIPLLFPKEGRSTYLYYKYYLMRILREVDKVVVPSENTKNDLLRHSRLSPLRIQVIHNGFNDRLAGFGSRDTSAEPCLRWSFGDYILYVGNQFPRKNLNRLIQAFSLVRKRLDVNLVLVGTTSESSLRSCQETARHSGVQDYVHILGVLPDQQLGAILHDATVLVQPSLYEGFGMTPLEGMAAGVPVCVSRCSSLPEVCGEAAVYFDPRDVPDMAKAMETLLASKEVRHQCIQKGLERVKGFDWRFTARSFVDMIREL